MCVCVLCVCVGVNVIHVCGCVVVACVLARTYISARRIEKGGIWGKGLTDLNLILVQKYVVQGIIV